MKRMAARLTTIDEPTRNELVKLCGLTAHGYGQLERTRPTGTISIAMRDDTHKWIGELSDSNGFPADTLHRERP
jgi:hypothetical protein